MTLFPSPLHPQAGGGRCGARLGGGSPSGKRSEASEAEGGVPDRATSPYAAFACLLGPSRRHRLPRASVARSAGLRSALGLLHRTDGGALSRTDKGRGERPNSLIHAHNYGKPRQHWASGRFVFTQRRAPNGATRD